LPCQNVMSLIAIGKKRKKSLKS